MKLNPISNLTFKGAIIDSHAHIGKWGGNEYFIEHLDEFIKQPLNVNGTTDSVEKIIVSNLSCIDNNGRIDEIAGNLEMLKESGKNSKYAPLAVCQPNLTGGDTSALKKLLDETDGKFFGLKFHPTGLSQSADRKTVINASNPAYDKYLDLAKEKNLPCLFHSEVAVDWSGAKPKALPLECPSDPRHIYNLAKRHPDVPVILGHTGMGAGPAHKEAIDVLMESIKKKDALLYADISWMDWADTGLPAKEKTNILSLLKQLKENDCLDRVMFGTDAPLGCYGENPSSTTSVKEAYEKTVGSIKSAIKNEFGDEADDIIQKVFHDNAENLFFKNKKEDAIKAIEEQSFTGNLKRLSPKMIACAGLAIAVLAICGKFIYDKIADNKTKQNQTPSKMPEQQAPLQTLNPSSLGQMNNFINNAQNPFKQN